MERFVELADDRLHISSSTLSFEAQLTLERPFKGLLTAGNDDARFRSDAALMWRYIESTRPLADRNGAKAMEELLRATAEPDRLGCRLTALSEAYRRGDIIPCLSDSQMEATKRHLVPAANALMTEALHRCGATLEDLQQETLRRTGLG